MITTFTEIVIFVFVIAFKRVEPRCTYAAAPAIPLAIFAIPSRLRILPLDRFDPRLPLECWILQASS